MVFQQHHALVAKMLDQALALFGTDSDAFEIVIGDLPGEVAGVEIGRAQPSFDRADRHPGGGVRVHDAMRIGQMPVEQRVLSEAGEIDRIGIVVELVAVNVDLDEVGGGDFAEMQPERVDQEGPILVRHLQRDVVVDHLVPTKHREHAVAGGELLARLPFSLADLRIAERCSHDSLLSLHFATLSHARGRGAIAARRRRPSAGRSDLKTAQGRSRP